MQVIANGTNNIFRCKNYIFYIKQTNSKVVRTENGPIQNNVEVMLEGKFLRRSAIVLDSSSLVGWASSPPNDWQLSAALL